MCYSSLVKLYHYDFITIGFDTSHSTQDVNWKHIRHSEGLISEFLIG